MPDTTNARRGLGTVTLELPERGYPVSENAVSAWFIARHGRAPSEAELGAILGAMAQREAQSPRTQSPGTAHAPLAEGWTTGSSAPPATRR